MIIEKAIEKLGAYMECEDLPLDEDFYLAVRLGNEAFKRINNLRFSFDCYLSHPLPGETRR